ncbi:LysR family transcriptional regulator [soil metagenome]
MSELEDIRAFVEVIEGHGFSAAARRLGASKSIISRRIARLEDDMGARLINRTTRGVSPTEAGVEFKLRGERILADLEEARDAVAQTGDAVVGLLRVAAPRSFLNQVGPVLAELAAAHPRLKVETAYSDARVDLIAERFDCAIRMGTLSDSSLIARKLAPIGGVLLAAPSYLDKRGRPETLADLSQHELLVRSGVAEGDVWKLQSKGKQVSVRVNGRFRSDAGEALMQAAIAGLGITALPTFMISDAMESGALVRVLPDYEFPEAGLYVVRPPGHAPGKVRALIDLLVARFGGTPYWDRCRMAEANVALASVNK